MAYDDVKRTAVLEAAGAQWAYHPVAQLPGAEKLPRSLVVLLENVVRTAADEEAAARMAQRIIEAGCAGAAGEEIEFSPARVLFQDFTGVPVFVDFAVMREACESLGGDPASINPQVPCDLVIDHSVIADEFGCSRALKANMALEFERNAERYHFLKWAQSSFDNVRIVPPGQGICHQVNVERFAQVVMQKPGGEGQPPLAYLDTVVGTDSHTPTVNGLGVLGWGVGGIEAEAAALGQPITQLVPRVVGVRLTGALPEGVTAMDAALTFAQVLRQAGVVGCFVECFGPGVAALTATQRACISNMTPEYGSTCTLFPVDAKTIEYLRVTGRKREQRELVEAYAKAQGLWLDPDEPQRTYAQVIEIDLSSVKRSLAGPSRPHDRIDADAMPQRFAEICAERGLDADVTAKVKIAGEKHKLHHGAIAIAAVTSCTTATDAAMMVQAGLLARKAAQLGLRPRPWVKTVFAPGSRATHQMLEDADLLDEMEQLGFATCGFGCMSCIGNSGPILPEMHDVADKIELASVLSGNRNFEGRISPDVAQNYLCAPAGVIAYALVGRMDFDFEREPIGTSARGQEIYLRDIWPSDAEVRAVVNTRVRKKLFKESGENLFRGTRAWRQLGSEPSGTFAWDEASTYVRRATYFDGMTREERAPEPIRGARAIALLGDFITTDHISPAGAIAPDSAAAAYLGERGVAPADFNTYGSRRGNHEVMARGTFANVKLANALAEGRMGGWTRDFAGGQIEQIFTASEAYRAAGVPLVVVAGKMYGSGSSRDWAAKGPALLGVKAVFAESFERIHRSNLIGFGILPLQFEDGQSAQSLGLDGSEVFDIAEIDFSAGLPNPAHVALNARRADGSEVSFTACVRIDTPTEGAYYRNGGILQYVLRNLAGRAE